MPGRTAASASRRRCAAHGVPLLFTLCGGHISPILVAAKARGIRIVDMRDEATAVFAADAVARLTGMPGRRGGHRRARASPTPSPRSRTRSSRRSPLVLLGGAAPTALQGRGALQDIDQRALVAPHVKLVKQVRRVADLGAGGRGGARRRRARRAGAGVRRMPGGPALRRDADPRLVRGRGRQGHARSPIGLLRWYLQPPRRRGCSPAAAAPTTPAPRRCRCPTPARGARRRGPPRRSRARAAAAARHRQPGAGRAPSDAQRGRRARSTRLGVPVYLSGMARGLLGREHALQMRHARRKALREADCVLLAGVPCDFRLDYGKHVRRSATLIAANRSAQGRAPEPPARPSRRSATRAASS